MPESELSLTIALSKGRIFDQTLPLLAHAGILPEEDPQTSRKLILPTNHATVKLVVVRASDVPTYVQYGAADLGVAGKDVLLEHGGAGSRMLTSGRGGCASPPSTSGVPSATSPLKASR